MSPFRMAPPGDDREFDIVLFGATGNAGRAMAEYLAENFSQGRWAIAGRNTAKLEALARALRREGKESDVCGIIEADVGDAKAMRAMASRARVLLAAAGPYVEYGEASVAACVETRTHYCDITGEVAWVARMRDAYGARAREAGVCMLSFCGYDCVPAELCSLLACEKLGSGAQYVELVFKAKKGGLPRGTALTVMHLTNPLNIMSTISGSIAYVDAKARGAFRSSMLRWVLPSYSSQTEAWTMPNVMGSINIPVVSTTLHRAGFPGVTIADRAAMPWRLTRWWTLWGLLPILAVYPLLALAYLVLLLPCARWPLIRYLKKRSFRGSTKGRTEVMTRAFGVSVQKKQGRGAGKGRTAMVSLVAQGDPGIYATALFACESALELLSRLQEKSKAKRPDPGFSTPIAALGAAPVAQRLRATGKVTITSRFDTPRT